MKSMTACWFPLAPMSQIIRILTGILFLLPGVLAWMAWTAPPHARQSLGLALLAALGIYAAIWFLLRPTGFEVTNDLLRIVWPGRKRLIRLAQVRSSQLITASDFNRIYGRGIRIGAGGLWGGFGLLKTQNATFSMWASRTDRFVIVELEHGRPLLITPSDPEKFVAMLLSEPAPAAPHDLLPSVLSAPIIPSR